jgi:hypothetical protein
MEVVPGKSLILNDLWMVLGFAVCMPKSPQKNMKVFAKVFAKVADKYAR